MGLVTTYSFLQDRNVVNVLTLQKGDLPNINVKHIIFITRPNIKLMDYIADNIHSEDKKSKLSTARKEFHLYFLPRKSQLCENHLKTRGVYGSLLNVGELKCNIFPVDNDLLSMELKNTYRLVTHHLKKLFFVLFLLYK